MIHHLFVKLLITFILTGPLLSSDLSGPHLDSREAQKVTIQVTNAPFDLVLAQLFASSSYQYVLAGSSSDTISINYKNADWHQVLEEVSKKAGLNYVQSHETYVFSPNQKDLEALSNANTDFSTNSESEKDSPLITIKLERAPLDLVIPSLIGPTRMNVVVSPRVAGVTTVRFKNYQWGKALRAVLGASGLDIAQIGTLLVVDSRDKIAENFGRDFLEIANQLNQDTKDYEIDLKLSRAPFDLMLKAILSPGLQSYLYSPALTRSTTVKASQQKAMLLLEVISRLHSLRVIRQFEVVLIGKKEIIERVKKNSAQFSQKSFKGKNIQTTLGRVKLREALVKVLRSQDQLNFFLQPGGEKEVEGTFLKIPALNALHALMALGSLRSMMMDANTLVIGDQRWLNKKLDANFTAFYRTIPREALIFDFYSQNQSIQNYSSVLGLHSSKDQEMIEKLSDQTLAFSISELAKPKVLALLKKLYINQR